MTGKNLPEGAVNAQCIEKNGYSLEQRNTQHFGRITNFCQMEQCMSPLTLL